MNIPNMPELRLAEWVDSLIEWMQIHFAPLFAVISGVVEPLVDFFERLLSVFPPLVMILLLSVVVWLLSNWRIALFSLIGFGLIHHLGLWDKSVETLSLVLSSTLISMLGGIPFGIWAGRSERAQEALRPILDFMQTMPAFVYLIPAVFFFALGAVPAVIASIVFSMPPTIRMTSLGIRQVSQDLKEAADAFGSTPWQRLLKVELPLAKPTIMAGINQTIMLALSMVVISSMIGAGGLGNMVLQAIARLQVGKGFEAGLAIVIIAIVLDRVTQSLGKSKTASVPVKGKISRASVARRWGGAAVAAVMVLIVAVQYVASGAEGQKVTLTYAAWDSEIASTHVIEGVLERAGYEVELKETEPGTMWTGVATGDAEAHVAGWLPITSKAFADKHKGNYVDLGPNLNGTYLGLVVPDYVPIDSIEDLNQHRDKFEGKIIGIDAGSGVNAHTEKAIKEYGLDFELVSGSDAAMTAALEKAYKQKKWIVVTGWEPHWKFNKFKLKFLKDPKKVYGGKENIHTIVRKDLKQDMPDVYRILDQFHWTKKDMGEVMLEVHDGKAPEEAAKEWLDKHPEKWKAWIRGVKQP